MNTTRVFFATDLHGSSLCFRKFLNAGKFYKANVVIVGGDITGKMVVPIIDHGDGTCSTYYYGTETIMKTKEQLLSFESTIQSFGYYPHMVSPHEMDELRGSPQQVDELFSSLMLDRTREWVKLADERLAGTEIKCFIQPGNDDRYEIDDVLKTSRTVINPEGCVYWIDDHHEMISTGHANQTPWKCPRDITEEDLEERIEAMAVRVKNMSNCVFCMHCPPYDTPLDQAPKLDQEFKPQTDGGKLIMIPAGSRAVRNTIEKYQPLLSLHGHIHESKGSTKTGRTLSLNPGSEYGESILRGALVDLTENGIKDFLFTSG